jgi:hypothetical protein
MLLGTAWIARRCQIHFAATIAAVLSAVFTISLAYGWWAAVKGGQYAPSAFFATYSRAWELATGALLALTLPVFSKGSSNWAGAVLTIGGLVAIALAAVTFYEAMPLLNIAILLPVLGAASVIAGVWLAPQTPAARLLGCQAMVAIGLVSYSWYLWHWPILAIARASTLGAENLWRDAGLAVGALLLALLTYIFVENPIRGRRVWPAWSNSKTLAYGAGASLLVIVAAVSLQLHAKQIGKSKSLESLMQAQEDKGWSRVRCRNRGGTLVSRSQCIGNTGSVERYLLIWGDSHADHSIGMFETTNKSQSIALLPRWMSGCPPLIGVVPPKGKALDEACNQFNAAVLAEIDQLQKADQLAGVVLGARWTTYLGKPSLVGEAAVALSRDGATKEETPAATLGHGLRSTLRKLGELGVKVLIIAPTPELRFEAPSCLARRSPEFCSISRLLAEQQRKVALQIVSNAMDKSQNVYLWDPLPTLCAGGICLVKRDGFVMYSDDEHLSYRGSRWLGPYLAESPSWLAMMPLASDAHEWKRH